MEVILHSGTEGPDSRARLRKVIGNTCHPDAECKGPAPLLYHSSLLVFRSNRTIRALKTLDNGHMGAMF